VPAVALAILRGFLGGDGVYEALRYEARRLATVPPVRLRMHAMPAPAALVEALNQIASKLRDVRCDDPQAAAKLEQLLPFRGPEVSALRQLLRAAVASREVAERENDGVRFSRVKKAQGDDDLSIDVVHMDKPALGHTHPNGEIDLCFAVRVDAADPSSPEPLFDGKPEGWQVFPPGSWHVPTVTSGAMDILYFLPGGAIRFEAAPS
jgi:hypothetical protein